MIEMNANVKEQMKNLTRDVNTVKTTLTKDVTQIKSMLQRITGNNSPMRSNSPGVTSP